ncbi:hypothetical protein K3217_14285 [bacterium BD-1]|nr:hypothetical protein [Ottowia caeni]
MASESVSRSNDELLAEYARQQHEEMTWKPRSESDPVERHHTKLHQAEMLAHTISGSDEFENLQRNVRAGVLWLLADLLTEAREAHDEASGFDRPREEAQAAGGGDVH